MRKILVFDKIKNKRTKPDTSLSNHILTRDNECQSHSTKLWSITHRWPLWENIHFNNISCQENSQESCFGEQILNFLCGAKYPHHRIAKRYILVGLSPMFVLTRPTHTASLTISTPSQKFHTCLITCRQRKRSNRNMLVSSWSTSMTQHEKD